MRKRLTRRKAPAAAKTARAEGQGGATAAPGFALRFSLQGAPPKGLYQDARLEALRRQLAALLDVVILTQGAEPVYVDGFKLVSELEVAPKKVYQIFAASGVKMPGAKPGPGTTT